MQDAQVIQKKIIAGFLAVLTTTGLVSAPANAAKYGGFGGDYAEVVSPKDAQLNEETANSEDVKAGKADLSKYISVVSSISDDLVISICIKKKTDFSLF